MSRAQNPRIVYVDCAVANSRVSVWVHRRFFLSWNVLECIVSRRLTNALTPEMRDWGDTRTLSGYSVNRRGVLAGRVIMSFTTPPRTARLCCSEEKRKKWGTPVSHRTKFWLTLPLPTYVQLHLIGLNDIIACLYECRNDTLFLRHTHSYPKIL